MDYPGSRSFCECPRNPSALVTVVGYHAHQKKPPLLTVNNLL